MIEINEYVGFQIVQLCRAHRQWAETTLWNELGIHVGQEMILFHLYAEEGLTQSRLAECLNVEPPTITKMLDRMKLLVERRPDPEDARVSRVYLTEHGKSLEPKVREVWRKLEERTLTGLNPAEQLLFRRLLMQAVNNLNQ
jgi:DNA-binding MarR family transcriptional regulator